MLMNKTFLCLIAIGSVVACAPANKNSKYQGGQESKITKDTKTLPQIANMDDQLLFAINEIGWARQAASLAVNPPNLSAKEGCVTRRPLKSSGAFLIESYECSRVGDTATTQRTDFLGTQTYRGLSGLDDIEGSFVSRIWTDGVLVSQGQLTHQIQIALPTGAPGGTSVSDVDLQSSVYKMTSKTTYKGDVALEAKRIGEEWSSSVTTGFQVSTTKALALITGSQVTFSYLPEVEMPPEGQIVKRSPSVVKLAATSDVSFVENENCLRPVGTFALSNDSTQVGTITTTGDGYTLSTETNTLHAWGNHCLER